MDRKLHVYRGSLENSSFWMAWLFFCNWYDIFFSCLQDVPLKWFYFFDIILTYTKYYLCVQYNYISSNFSILGPTALSSESCFVSSPKVVIWYLPSVVVCFSPLTTESKKTCFFVRIYNTNKYDAVEINQNYIYQNIK